MTYKLTGQEPYQIPTNADLGTIAYQSSDAINVGLVNIANTASISGLVSALTVGYSQSAANTVLYLTQVPTTLAAGQPVSGSNIAANSTVSSFVSGFSTTQPTYTGTTATTVVAMTSTYGLSVGFGVAGTGLTYGTTVTSISSVGLPVVYSATSATTADIVLWIGTTTNVVTNTAVFGSGINSGTFVNSILANTYAVLNQAITLTTGTAVTFVPTVTLSAAITANTLTQTVLFYPIIRMNQNSSAAVTQGTVASVYTNPTSAASAALVIQNGGLGVTGNGYFANNLSVTGAVSISSSTSAGSTTTGALTVVGGVGIGGGLVVGGTVTATSFVGSFSGTISGTASTASQVNTVLQTGNVSYYPTFVNANNASATGMSVYTTSSFSINPSTGVVTLKSIVDSFSTTTGALQVVGGVGVGGNVNISGTVTGGGIRTSSTSTTPSNPTVGDIWYNTSTDDIYRYTSDGVNAYWLDITGATVANVSSNFSVPVSITNNTASTSTTTGALTVVGGVGIGGAVNIGGSISIAGKKAVNGPAFGAYADATLQTITSGSQQKVLFQVEEFDTDNCFTNSRFTPTVEGYYQLNAEVRLDGSSGTGEIMLVLWKNTGEHKRGTNQSGTSIGTNFFAQQVSALVYANGTTDYFEIKVQQTSGSSLTVTAVNNPAITWFNGAMVRGA